MLLLTVALIATAGLAIKPPVAPADAATPLTEGNILVVSGGVIYEYTKSGTQVQAIDVPYPGDTRPVYEMVRDIVVDDTGIIQVYNGTSDPFLSAYDPSAGTWVHNTRPGWSTVNGVSYGGIASFQEYVYVTDMRTLGDGGQDEAAGMIRFNTTDYASERFADNIEFIDLTMGLDGLLYGLYRGGNTVSVHDPLTLSWLRTVFLGASVRGIAVNEDGEIFGASWDGHVYRFDTSGGWRQRMDSGSEKLTDIDISSDGQLLVGSRFGDVILIDESLTGVSSFRVGRTNTFVAFIAGNRPTTGTPTFTPPSPAPGTSTPTPALTPVPTATPTDWNEMAVDAEGGAGGASGMQASRTVHGTDPFDIDVWLTDGSIDYQAYQENLQYDPAVLEFDAHAFVSTPFTMCLGGPTVNEIAGTLYAGCANLSPTNYEGPLETIAFHCLVQDGSTSPLHLVTLLEDPRFGTGTALSAQQRNPTMLIDASITCAAPGEDSDGDGCANSEEVGPDPALGGQRDPLNPWDFYDVPVPAAFDGGTLLDRDKAVSAISDALAVMQYVGTSDGGLCNSGPDRIRGNADDRCYDQDRNGDGEDDGLLYDRSVGATWSDAPDGAITIVEDMALVLAQSGHSCQAPP